MKMTRVSLVLGVVIALIVCFVGGCDKPTAEMRKAERAIESARKAGAAEAAAAELESAEKALAEGRELMDDIRYREARSSFEEAYRLALAARDKALAGQAKDESVPTPLLSTAKRPYSPPTSHTVYKGECLWRISEYRDIYDDPFQWPLIYDANRKKIDRTAHAHGFQKKEENWIFPGQEFDIPRDVSIQDIKNARRRTGAPTPYVPPGM
jgi:nucleoid-associated protein YgaU